MLGFRLAQAPARKLQEHVVERRPGESHGLRRHAILAKQPEQNRKRLVPLVDGDLQHGVARVHFQNQRTGFDDGGRRFGLLCSLETERDDVAGDLLFEFGRAAQRDDSAEIDNRDAVAQRVGFFEIMRGQEKSSFPGRAAP